MLLTGCGTDSAAPQEVPWNQVPANLVWTDYQGMQVPTSDQDGPTGTAESGVPNGYGHTPPGAALAGINATIRMSVAPDDQWAAVGQALIAPGPERDAWAVARASLSITLPVAAGKAPIIKGYQLTAYTPAAATVRVYSTQTDKSMTANTMKVVWRDGDWRLLLPSSSDQSIHVAAVTNSPADAVTLAH